MVVYYYMVTLLYLHFRLSFPHCLSLAHIASGLYMGFARQVILGFIHEIA